MTFQKRLVQYVVKTAMALALLARSAEMALATGEITKLLTEGDAARLLTYEKVRIEAVSEAKAGGSAEDLAVLDAVLSGASLSFHESFNPVGAWKCRTLKLGGLLPLTTYPWFKCKISDDGSGWRLEKISGSQRTSGKFYDDSDTRLIYLGASHYSGEKPRMYASDSERDQVAYVFRVGDSRLRLEFPSPKFESKLDILELTR
jgi:hypothetical protein